MSTWIFPHKYKNHKEREAWGHVRCIPILNQEIGGKRGISQSGDSLELVQSVQDQLFASFQNQPQERN